MIMGWLFDGKVYNHRQIAAVGLLTAGMVLATWSNAENQVYPSTGAHILMVERQGCRAI